MKPISHLKPWARLGISKEKYKAARLWKKAGMSREKYEAMILAVPQEIIEEHRREVEVNSIMEQIFGKEIASEL